MTINEAILADAIMAEIVKQDGFIADVTPLASAALKALSLDEKGLVEKVAHAVSEAGGAANWEHALEVSRAAIEAITTPINSEPLYSGYAHMDEEHTRVPQIADSEGLDALVERLEATIHRINNHWWNKRARPTAPDIAEAIAALASSLPLRGLE